MACGTTSGASFWAPRGTAAFGWTASLVVATVFWLVGTFGAVDVACVGGGGAAVACFGVAAATIGADGFAPEVPAVPVVLGAIVPAAPAALRSETGSVNRGRSG